MDIPAGALSIIKGLEQHGHKAYLVGGCVRDLLLGQAPREWDITTSARPDQVIKLFDKVIPTGVQYGTVTVLLADGQYEVTTFRADERYVDGRHPSNVIFTDDLHRDLARRDFTINALALEPGSGRLIDDWDGQADLRHRIIRTVGEPADRFREDGLRPLRGCRFAARLEFEIEEKTLAAIPSALQVVALVSPERIHDELVKMLSARRPSIGIELMRRSGLLQLVLPELEQTAGVEQPPQYHKYDVYWHSLHACDSAPANDYRVRLAALLHDIGKPPCKVDLTFHNHDQVGAEMAEAVLRRLKFSNADIDLIVNLIINHMFDYSAQWSDAAVRRFLRRIGGAQNTADLFALRRADAAAMEQEIGLGYLGELEARIGKILAEENALHVSDLKVNGSDVMQALGIAPGPKVGEVLCALLEKVLDDPILNQREKLLEQILKHA